MGSTVNPFILFRQLCLSACHSNVLYLWLNPAHALQCRFNATPAASLEVVAKELFKRLDIEVLPSQEAAEYNAGLTTQIPAGFATVVVKGRNISRKITVAGRTLRYAKASSE